MRVVGGAVLALVLVAAAACSGGDDAVSVGDPWGRPSPSSADNAAFYMTLTGGSQDDVLTSAASARCTMTELHETTMTDGTMSMAPVPSGIQVPANEMVKLEPGGLHVMCMGVTTPLSVGESVDIELTFSSGDTTTVSADVRDQ
ncbi:MAG: copper chaperone PCu(A)C [Armatimonadetes bacterium]|nr:MAG: copper chaperone PCu(A)C [Armatimonadota bacterium]